MKYVKEFIDFVAEPFKALLFNIRFLFWFPKESMYPQNDDGALDFSRDFEEKTKRTISTVLSLINGFLLGMILFGLKAYRLGFNIWDMLLLTVSVLCLPVVFSGAARHFENIRQKETDKKTRFWLDLGTDLGFRLSDAAIIAAVVMLLQSLYCQKTI